MKKTILTLFFGIMFFGKMSAVIHHIGVDGCSFNPPVNNNVHLGDTIEWFWDASTPRRTSSVNTPPGAMAWDHLLDETNLTFRYVPSVVGQYFYKSNIMPTCIASFMILAPVGVTELKINTNNCAFFPNPVKTSFLLIHPKNATIIEILDLEGNVVQREKLDEKETNDEIILNNLKAGNYIISVRQKKSVIYNSKIIIVE